MSHHIKILCRLSLIGLLWLSLQLPSAANALLIDDFSESSVASVTSDPNGNAVAFLDSGLNVFGGKRLTTIYTESQAIPGFDTVTVSFFSGSGMSFLDDNSSAGWSGRVALTYSPAGLLPAEDIGVEIDILAYDGPAAEAMFVTALLDGTPGLPAAAVPGPQTLQVLFPGGVSTVNDLTISFQVPAGGDFRIDAIRTFVPEPSTALLAGLGLAGLAFVGRKR